MAFSKIISSFKSKNSQVFGFNRRQKNRPLPNSIIYYITKNPSSPKVYQKLIQCCKYFYLKNPIIIIEKVILNPKKDCKIYMPIINGYRIDFSTTLTKFWIIDTFEIRAYEGNEGLKLLPPPSVIPPLYKCHAKRLTLRDLEISYADFKFLSLNAEDILLFHILVVNNEDGSIIPMEKIIQSLPKVEHLTIFLNTPNTSIITSNTVKNLLNIPHFLKIKSFACRNIPETFEIETFFKFMKNNGSTMQCSLDFCNPLSNEYKIRLNQVIDKVIKTKKPFFFIFDGVCREKRGIMQLLYHQKNRNYY